jgi:hypothetical protein
MPSVRMIRNAISYESCFPMARAIAAYCPTPTAHVVRLKRELELDLVIAESSDGRSVIVGVLMIEAR